MKRLDWLRHIQFKNQPILIDLCDTPLSAVIVNVKIVGPFAEFSEEGEILIKIFRDDPKDAPNNINLDMYKINDSADFGSPYKTIIEEAATADDPPLQNCLSGSQLVTLSLIEDTAVLLKA